MNLETHGSDAESTEEGHVKVYSGDDQKTIQPPDSKKFERDLGRLQVVIREKEASFKSMRMPRFSSHTVTGVNAPKDRETLINELRELKAKREKEIEARKQFDQELKTLNTQVSYKNDACSKLQAGLRYKTETRIDDSVRRLEHQINAQQLTLNEEKRIVSEIDALKRSKKCLHEFLELKQVINKLRERLGSLRSQRNECVKRINASKLKEEQINKALDAQQQVDETKQEGLISERESLKAEIDQLYGRKRQLTATFNREKNDYHAAVHEVRTQAKLRRIELAAAKKAEEKPRLEKRSKEQRPPKDPYEKEKTVCANLITYMERLQSANVPGVLAAEVSVAGPEPEHFSVAGADSSGDGSFLRRKSAHDELVGVYAGLGKVTRKGSKKGRRSSAKEVPRKLTLHPLVMDQLFSLDITPPSTVADIPNLLEELRAKKVLFDESLAPSEETEQNSGSATQMSPIVEELPSLPTRTAAKEKNHPVENSNTDEGVSSDKMPLVGEVSRASVTAGSCDQCESRPKADDGSHPDTAVSLSSVYSAKGTGVDEKISDASEGHLPSGNARVNEIGETSAPGGLDEEVKADVFAAQNDGGDSEAGSIAKLSDGIGELKLSPEQHIPLASGSERTSAEKAATLKECFLNQAVGGGERLKDLSAEIPLENGQESVKNLSCSQAAYNDSSLNSRHSPWGIKTESNGPDHDISVEEASLAINAMKNELPESPVNITCAEKCVA